MPKLWNDTIETHRSQVRDAVLDAAAALVFEEGLRGVTMSQVAERAGIGRATLYKYFPDVETILRTWHARQIDAHIVQLTRVREGAGGPGERLHAVLTAYAHIARQTRSHDQDLVRFLHPDPSIVTAQQQLRDLIEQLLVEGADAGEIRDDVPAAELSTYCLHALAGAAESTSDEAVARLVGLTLAGLRPH
ncbi:TetR/AcrR family transcriptional regulator [Nocardia alni]|uniref:TetR/AcrR family transcriptional regulator n=1 Tax=Nocardia alni TaxID=2815723 RepID=UPI001C210101|nr:TetR/AcrR family transcriptional regulator [Nocardia alni]